MRSKTIIIMMLALVLGLSFLGCSKMPEQLVSDTKASVDGVIAEGGEKYAKEEVKLINDDLTAAMDEIAVQEGKFFKNYDKAKEMYTQVKAKADALKAEIPARKEKAKTEAQAAVDAATLAVTDAKALLGKAPKGKGSMADIEMFNSDMKGLDDSLTETQGLMTNEDYFVAIDKANGIKDKAASISTQITEAIEKVKAAKGKKK